MHKSAKLALQAGDGPVGYRSALSHMLPNESTNFPEDRVFQDRRNKAELDAQKGRGTIHRLATKSIPALGGEFLEVEFTTR